MNPTSQLSRALIFILLKTTGGPCIMTGHLWPKDQVFVLPLPTSLPSGPFCGHLPHFFFHPTLDPFLLRLLLPVSPPQPPCILGPDQTLQDPVPWQWLAVHLATPYFPLTPGPGGPLLWYGLSLPPWVDWDVGSGGQTVCPIDTYPTEEYPDRRGASQSCGCCVI